MAEYNDGIYVPSTNSQASLKAFLDQAMYSADTTYAMRSNFRKRDLEYMREMDFSEEQFKAAYANHRGDPTKFQNIIMPVIMPQVEQATTYQVGVFLTGHPIFSFVAPPGKEDVAIQMDTIVADQQRRGQWVTELTQTFRDGFKYNLCGIDCSMSHVMTAAPEAGQRKLLWQGNKVRKLDMYNSFWDTSVQPRHVATRGMFGGYHERITRTEMIKRLADFPRVMNKRAALESSYGSGTITGDSGYEAFYVPQLNWDVFSQSILTQRGEMDWYAWAQLVDDKKRSFHNNPNSYLVTTLYARIVPRDHGMVAGVPSPDIPSLWKFVWVNSQVLVYAERLTNAHDYLPIMLAQPLDDGLGYQTKSFGQNLSGIQSVTSALINSGIAARRRAIGDRLLYDTGRVEARYLSTDSPVARIPVRPSATGQGVENAVRQLPFEDSQFGNNHAELQNIMGMGYLISGQNQARQGQFVKGNKTRFEFAETLGNANSRDQLIAITFEDTLFTPLKEVIKANILQYQQTTRLFNPDSKQAVDIDPIALREVMGVFKASDGLLPSDKLIDGESLEAALTAIAQSPQLAAGFNLAPMFSHLMKSRGANLAPFEKSPQQMAYEQAMGQWQQVMAALAEQLKGLPPEQLQQALQQAVPQPTPEQFGYDPAAQVQKSPTESAMSNQGPSILQQALGETGATETGM